jgi:protein-S-isoprenylcysteine O-methyltransferase Ste14
VALSNGGVVRWPAEPWNAAVRIVGIAVLWAAGFMALWGIRSIGRNMASAAEVRPDTEVVTGGAFGLVRHPMYLSILMLWGGAALALLSWALAIGFAILIPAFYARARAEERLLMRHFGAAYTAYVSRVPMLLPWPRPRGVTTR